MPTVIKFWTRIFLTRCFTCSAKIRHFCFKMQHCAPRSHLCVWVCYCIDDWYREDTLLLKTAEQCRMWVRLLLACSWYSLQELESREKWPQSSRKWSLRARPALLPGAPLKVRLRSCWSYLRWRFWILCNRGAFYQWIYYCNSSKSTGKETGKTHLCAMCIPP